MISVVIRIYLLHLLCVVLYGIVVLIIFLKELMKRIVLCCLLCYQLMAYCGYQYKKTEETQLCNLQ